MKKSYKILAIIMSGILALSLVACKEASETTISEDKQNEMELTLENIENDYLYPMRYLWSTEFNSDEPITNILGLKMALDSLYKKENGKSITDENNYVFVEDYLDVAQRYFDIDIEMFAKILRESEMYDKEQDKTFGVDGVGNINHIEATDYEFENNILTVQYRYGDKYDTFIFVLNSMQIEITEDGSFKYISNTVGEKEYSLSEDGNVSEYIQEEQNELTPEAEQYFNSQQGEIIELFESLNGVWSIANDRMSEAELYHFYANDNRAYVDVYDIAEIDIEVKLVASSEVVELVMDADGNYHLTTSGSYINPNGGEVLVLNLGERGDYKVEINREEYTYYGDNSKEALNVLMFDRDDKKELVANDSYTTWQLAGDSVGDGSWRYIGITDKKTGYNYVINEAIPGTGLIFDEGAVYIDGNNRLMFIDDLYGEDIEDSVSYLDLSNMQIIEPTLDLSEEYLDNIPWFITDDENGNTILIHTKNPWPNQGDQDIIISVYDKDFNHISTEKTSSKLKYSQNVVSVTAKDGKVIGEYLYDNVGVFLEYEY